MTKKMDAIFSPHITYEFIVWSAYIINNYRRK